ncbi:MAG: tRNA guanosine(34) transglycosylase Tgt, partial [Polyangiaceae bacterium]
PEDAVRIQGLIGADIQMQLDICPPGDSPRGIVEQAVERTTRWARRALAVPRPERQAMFGIVQGALWLDLRLLHAQTLAELPFDGLALGGFSVGESNDRMHETLSQVVSALDPQRPRYVMGIGTPRDIVRAICAGADMFDCVMPTRNARNGQAFTRSGRIVIKQARFRNDPRPLDEDCTCACCSRGYSRAYLRHLYLAREVLCLRLLSLHNLHFYGSIVSGARAAIEGHRLAQWSATTLFAIDEGVA